MERNRRIQATSFALPKRRNHDNIAQPSWASRGLSRPREHRPPASPARGDTTWPRCFAGAVFMAEIVILSAAYLGSLEFCLRVSSWHLHERFRAGTDLFRKACEFGFEGLISKRRDRPYQAGRSKYWVKVKNRQHPAMSRVMESFR